MASPIIPKIIQQDINGNPAVGWKLSVFEVGTSTPKASYSDAALTTLNANPVILDSLGMASVYYDGVAKLVMKDSADVTKWEEPNVGNDVDIVKQVDTLAALKTTPITRKSVYVLGRTTQQDGYEGNFQWLTGDYTTQISADTQEAFYVKHNDYATTVGAWVRSNDRPVTARMFGCKGDVVTTSGTDDGVALNAVMRWIRDQIDQSAERKMVEVDFEGLIYSTSISINGTAMREGMYLRNGTILGKCTGKVVLDLIGSRYGRLSDFHIIGDVTNRPSKGVQWARSGTAQFAFCDGWLLDRFNTSGYFSVAAVHAYGQEGTLYSKCKFWNSDKDAYIAIHTGYDIVPMFSDYLTPITGSTSYVCNKYTEVDYHFIPDKQATITGITKANPAVITAPGHPFANGDVVALGYIGGMIEIHNTVVTVANVTANTFEASGVNSTAYTTYTSGGAAIIAQTKPSILLSRMEQQRWDTCYCVNYGADSIQIEDPDEHTLEQLTFDFLFEGAASRSHYRFSEGITIRDIKIYTYNTAARDSFFSIDSGSAGTVAIFNADISIPSHTNQLPLMFDDPTRYALYSSNVLVVSESFFSKSTLIDRFTGILKYISTGGSINVNTDFHHHQDGAFTPVVTSTVGTITAYTVTAATRVKRGDLVYLSYDIAITNNGTGSGILNITAPYTSSALSIFSGSGGNLQVFGTLPSGSTTISIKKYDGTYPAVTGESIRLSGVYRV